MNNAIPPVFLAGEKIRLCAIDPAGDLSGYVSWINDQGTTRYMGSGNFPATREKLLEYIAGFNSGADLLLGIFSLSKGLHVGNIVLHMFDYKNSIAELGILVGEKSSRGKGYGSEAVMLLLEHAFMRLNLNKVTTGAVKGNVASQKLFEKAGFVIEGVLREHFYLEGKYHDCLRYGMLRREFNRRKT